MLQLAPPPLGLEIADPAGAGSSQGQEALFSPPPVPGGPSRSPLALPASELDRITREFNSLLDRRIILKPRDLDRVSPSRVVSLRQLCHDWLAALSHATQASVRLSVHGSVASRLLTAETPVLAEGGDIDLQIELDLALSP